MKEISLKEFKCSPFRLIGDDWSLVSAGNENSFNTMTISWGHLGALWGNHLYGRPTVVIYIRPSRYTDQFIDKEDYFSLTFFDEEYRKDLLYLGSHSGRDENKLNKTQLHSFFIDGVPTYQEATFTLVCKKIYKGNIFKENFIEKDILNQFYKDGDFHHVYIAEVIKIYQK